MLHWQTDTYASHQAFGGIYGSLDDTIDEFDTLEEAISKKDELFNDDPTQRVYKVVENVDGSFVDL